MAQKNKSMETRVRDAFKELGEKGEEITNAKVREITGGSFRDVSPLVKKIKFEFEEKAKAERAIPDMPEEVQDAAQEIWALAWAHADETAAAERRGHAVEVDKLKAEISEQEEAVGIVEKERDDADKRADAAEAENAKLAEELRQTQLLVAELKGRLAERAANQQNDIDQETKVSPAEIKRVMKMSAQANKGEQPDMFSAPKNGEQKQPPSAAE